MQAAARAPGALLQAAARALSRAIYIEDNQAYGLDGAFITTVAADAHDYDEHEDEAAHTAMMTRADDAGSSSGNDGDDWLGQLCDDTAFLAATKNGTAVTSSGTDSRYMASSSSRWYCRASWTTRWYCRASWTGTDQTRVWTRSLDTCPQATATPC